MIPLFLACAIGPDWEEGGLDTADAGPLPGSAQTPKGQPPLSPLLMITGDLEGPGLAGGDEQDMYLILIADPPNFSATANAPVAASVGLNAQLWLFRSNGLGLLANDGIADSAGFGNQASDGSGAMVTFPGLYYLAISSFNSDPVDSSSNLLFSATVPGEVSGPDGPGGANPIAGWTPGGAGGEYMIMLSGVVFMPCLGDTNADGFVDVDDLLAVILAWDTSDPGADVNDSGLVDIDDLIIVLLNWGQCNPIPPPV